MKVLKGAGSGSDRFTVDDATEILPPPLVRSSSDL